MALAAVEQAMAIFIGGPETFGSFSQDVQKINGRHSRGRIRTLLEQ
jgi:hypothetical protein